MSEPEPEGHGHPSGVPVSRSGHRDRSALDHVLERSKAIGLLGPGSTLTHFENGLTFVDALTSTGRSGNSDQDSCAPDHMCHVRVLDLGSGGGVPGLVIAWVMTGAEVVLLDAAEKRTAFLAEAVAELGLGQRVRVLRGRAEDLAHDPEHRCSFDVVTARSFAPPPVTAECAVGFLAGPGARVLVSEPPRQNAAGSMGPDHERWPTGPLAQLGLRPGPVWRRPGSTVQQLDVTDSCPDEVPRRVGVPSRRPWY